MKEHHPYGIYERFFKRALDVICALPALIVFCWLYALTALPVRLRLGSPVLFSQERPGKNEKIKNISTDNKAAAFPAITPKALLTLII